MLVNVLRTHKRKLGRSAALLLLTGMAAGCSSQVARFNTVDDIFTGSTDNQRQIIKKDATQEYPGDTAAVTAAPAAPVYTGSVSRSTLSPVAAQPFPEPARPAPVQVAEAQEPAPRPVAVKPLFSKAAEKPKADAPFKNAEPDTQATASAATDASGWSRVGGKSIVVRDGESVYSLSKRYGVPANVIAQVNGMPAGNGLQVGQKIIIPTLVDGAKVAAADPIEKQNPLPANAPKTAEAVLPKAPKAKDASKLAVAPAADGKKKPEQIAASAGGYTVQSGDTLSRIAKKTGVSVASLKAANGLQDGVIKIGQSLKVQAGGAQVASAKPAVDATTTSSTPPAKKATAAAAETASYTPPQKASKVMEQAEASTETAPNATGIGKMRWPVRGRVVSGYGKGGGKSNDGIDIAVPEGTPVKAAENGVVIYAGDGLKEFGNTVLVRHENGLVTVYGNASSLNVKRGEKVKRGQDIAVSGMSGNADSPKLHFEVRKNSAPVDPSTFLE